MLRRAGGKKQAFSARGIDASIYKFVVPSQDGRWLDVWGWTGGVKIGPGGPL